MRLIGHVITWVVLLLATTARASPRINLDNKRPFWPASTTLEPPESPRPVYVKRPVVDLEDTTTTELVPAEDVTQDSLVPSEDVVQVEDPGILQKLWRTMWGTDGVQETITTTTTPTPTTTTAATTTTSTTTPAASTTIAIPVPIPTEVVPVVKEEQQQKEAAVTTKTGKSNKKSRGKEELTVYMQEADGSYVAVVVPSEAVMNQLVSKKADRPASGVQKTIYLKSLGRTSVRDKEPVGGQQQPAYKPPSTEFTGPDIWSGPLSPQQPVYNFDGFSPAEGQVRRSQKELTANHVQVDQDERHQVMARLLELQNDFELKRKELGYTYSRLPSLLL